MTIEHFLQMLECCDGKWNVTDDGDISDDNEYCPIWAVYSSLNRDEDWPEDVFQAGEIIGLSERQVRIIMLAADNRFPRNNRVRNRLLSLIE